MKTMKLSLGILPFVVLLTFGCGGNRDKLLDHGHETQATIRSKKETTAIKAKNRHYILTFAFFAQDSAEIAQDKHQNDVLKDTTISMADRIEKWQPGGGTIGDYSTAEIEVSRPLFDKYREGDQVQIVYLPEDPTVVMLKEEL